MPILCSTNSCAQALARIHALQEMPRIEIYSNYNLLATIKLEVDTLIIGRDPESHICMPDSRVSRTQAVIRRTGDNHEIENKGTNLTKVNGKEIHEPCSLRPGDSVFIARYVLVYEAEDPDLKDSVNTVLLD